MQAVENLSTAFVVDRVFVETEGRCRRLVQIAYPHIVVHHENYERYRIQH
jgi:hypothetical protein